ncbi:uncharacterized protein SAMN06297144_3019 [Sphingomonas guangdongensis]|uniref:DUF418 domain-containing protein n=1 Tax=Sphingomonas guangdongensis TaxID=1141890 RepID=A0A285R1B1_9SPHN|nr:DUF418 domain-containing protein [Sphingomonas guangdongensis]SOB87881.1 uncharacterized protein SAMN06297144_3019 [Sphingomonas guangdongensis]
MGDDAAADARIDGTSRIAALDVLRGVAILGILFMNIAQMGGTWAAAHSSQPNLLGWSALDRAAWGVREVLATGTARGLLQLLFGAGVVILTDRVAAGGARWSAAARFYWRNAVLLAFGLFHVWVLLWAGDILHVYALCAMLAYPLRRLRPRWLILLALVLSGYGTFMSFMGTSGAIRGNRDVAAARRALEAGREPTAEQKKALEGLEGWHRQLADGRREHAEEVAVRRSNLAGQARVMRGEWLSRYQRWRGILMNYTTSLGVILLGAALFKLDILQGRRSPRYYARMALGWYGLALPVRVISTIVAGRVDDTVTILWAFNEWTRIAMTLGHVGLILFLLTTTKGGALLRPLSAAGRTALSIYLLQTIICLWVIYPGWGLGLLARQGWAGLMLTAAIVDAMLLALAVSWVRRFDLAPAEWAWRSLASGRALPFGRRAGARPHGTVPAAA